MTVGGEVRGQVDRGFLVLLGVTHEDTAGTCDAVARKVVNLRVFEDDDGKMNRSLADVDGAVLCISQFTLYGDVRRGNRPSFTGAALPAEADELYQRFCNVIRDAGIACEKGVFGAHMEVALVNDGPVTILVDSDELKKPRDA